MEKKLYKSSNDKVLAGVCGGFAEYFAVDTVVVRLLWIVFTFMGFAGLIAYIIAAIIMPESPLSGSLSDNYTSSDGYGTEQKTGNKGRSTSIVLGIILILFGGFVLLKYFIPWIPEDLVFAAALIGLGLFFLVRKSR